MKINVLNHSKKFLYTFCALILVAIVILCVFGFNLGTDLKGYVELRVNYNSLYFDTQEEFVDDFVGLLKENGAKVVATNFEGSGLTENLVVKIDKKYSSREENLEFVNTLKQVVEDNYNDELLVFESSLVEGYMTETTIIRFTYTVLISLIIVMVYLLFRVRLINTICILATSFTTGILMTVLMILTRVPLNSNVFGVMATMILLSTTISTIIISDIRKHSKEQLEKEEIGVIDLVAPKMLCYYAIILTLLIFVIFGSAIMRSYATLSILGIISVCLADNLVLIPLRYYLNNYTITKVIEVEVDEEETEDLAEEVAE